MHPKAQEILDRLVNFGSKFSLNQRVIILATTALVIALFVMLVMWLTRPEYAILYTNLSAEDANKVVKILETDNIKYEFADNASTIMVPVEDMYNLRIKVAGEGNLVGQGIGFEIFDTIQMGQTEFVQRINYQRALQGELARTIEEFPNVESARVHLVIPVRSLFVEEQQEPSASVIISLEDAGIPFSPKEVNGMVNLLTMAIEGLQRTHVSITDSTGKSLFSPEDESAVSNKQLDHQLRVEGTLERRIGELLTPILGIGKHIAKVSVDIDFNKRTIRIESYDPDSAVIRSEQQTEETQRGTANLGSNVADVNFRGDGLGDSLSTQESQRESRTQNYEINRQEENIIASTGSIERLTVAVAVDGTYVQNEAGQWEYTPRTEEELEKIRTLVANAIGLDLARGDSLEVTNISFGSVELPVQPDAAELLAEFAKTMGTPLLLTLLAFIIIMMVIRPVMLNLVRPKVEAGEMMEGLEGLPSAEEQRALYEAQDDAARSIAEQERVGEEEVEAEEAYTLGVNLDLEEIKNRTLQMAERNMEQSIRVIRVWMKKPAELVGISEAA